MSALHDKIISYTHERGIEFNEPGTNTPIRTGTANLGVYAISNSLPIYGTEDSVPGGEGYWRFRRSTAGNSSMFSSSTTNAEFEGMVDGLFTLGFWFYFEDIMPPSTASLDLFSQNSLVNKIAIRGSQASTNPSKLEVRFTTSTIVLEPTIEPNTWYFVAARRFANTTNNIQIFLNGELVRTLSRATPLVPAFHRFGSTQSIAANTFYRISNYFHGTPEIFDQQAIEEIWATGASAGGQDAIITETPATASAESVNPLVQGGALVQQTPATSSALQT